MKLKFPHTPHLAWLGDGSARQDKVLHRIEALEFLSHEVTVEEKLDGANIGISFDAEGELVVQNRGTVLRHGEQQQFQPLWPWIALRQSELRQGLGQNLVLFGEWCFAVHSVRYNSLPDYLIAFDVFDALHKRFWSTNRRNDWASQYGIETAPQLKRGRFELCELEAILLNLKSAYGSERVEGLYLRWDEGEWLGGRAKLVRAEFVQAIGEHWSKRMLESNKLERVNP